VIDLTQPQRQSTLAIVFLGLRILRSIGIAQLAIALLFLFQAPLSGALVFLPFAAILLLGALSALAWWRYTFVLVDGELVVTKGILRVDRLTVPVDRIQSLAIDQQLLHRLTGLVKVAVDTAGSSEAEFTIDAVSRPVAEELQRQAVLTQPPTLPNGLGGITAAGPLGQNEDQIVFTHGPGRLLRAALTAWPLSGLIVLGPLIAAGDQLADRIPDDVPEIDADGFQWWWLPIGIVGFIVFSVILNVVRVFLQDWQLTLRASPSSLRRTSGLLSRTSKASSVSRIQVVASEQNPLQRMAGLRSVHLSTIGEGDLGLVGCDDGQWETIRTLARSEIEEGATLDRRIRRDQVWLAVRNITIISTMLAFGGFFIVSAWSLLAFGLVPVMWWTQRRDVQTRRWGLGNELAMSRHVIDSSTQQALVRKANSVAVSQSIFERRRGLGRVHLKTAAGSISIGMIPIEEAHAVRDTVLHVAETDHRPWM
jgi:putative membrane protein